jgi:DNA-binding response OmpR family regulator/predicted regulator of Ras-like GTPase activity (Roadblock/LC7/MglB family)
LLVVQYSVLIVDGDPDYIQYLGGTLKANGFESAGTSSGANALQIYKKDNPDLVIADLDIAEMDGLELLRELRNFDPKTKLILTTMSASKELITNAFRMGALDILEKPIDIEFLTNKVQELLSREDRDLEGNLRMMSLASIIQINCEERNQAQLILNFQGSEGQIFFNNGEMIHAEVGDLTGEEAVYALLGWEEGSFQVKMGVEPSLQTIEKPWSGVLLEGMRRIDETTAGWSPEWDDEVTDMNEEQTSDLPQRINKAISSIREVNHSLICSLDGTVLAQEMDGNVDEFRNWGIFIQEKSELIGGFLNAGDLDRAVLSAPEERYYLQQRDDHLVLLTLNGRASAETVYESVEMIFKRYQ